MQPPDLSQITAEILASRKYRGLSIPAETVADLIAREWPKHHNPADALQAVRSKLHNIVAPYLGDPDYAHARSTLDAAFASGKQEQVKAECLRLLAAHASTRERIPLLEQFYHRLWAVTRPPRVVLDLACGLHPLGLPWMGLPTDVQYHAYDIHQPRLALLNHFLALNNLPPLAEQRDILLSPPEVEADVAIFFKEAHRFEQRRKGCTRAFLQALRARWLLVSLPSESLTGRRSLAEQMRQLVYTALQGLDWPVCEVIFPGEIVFCIRKSPQEQP